MCTRITLGPVSLCPIQAECGGCPHMPSPLEDQRAALIARVERQPVSYTHLTLPTIYSV